jgi:hypothetical protein
MMLLWILACGIGQREACESAKTQAQGDWKEVADYYQRMAALEEPKVAEAQAQLDAMGEEREKAERRRRNVQTKRTTGLVDLRDGSERIDEEASAAMAPKQGRARRARDESADAEAEAILDLMEVADHYAHLQSSAELASSILADFKAGPWSQGMTRVPESAALSDTELTAIAVQASEKAQGLCEGL